MEWITGGRGARAPVDGARVGPGWDAWAIGTRWRSVEADGARLVAVGECTADEYELARAAVMFARGDVRAPMCLSGSMWVLARHGRETWVYGDLAGVRPLYVAETPRGVVWASRMTPLAALVGAAVDWAALAAEIAVGGVDSTDRPGFVGVRQVRPGRALVVDDDGSWTEHDVRAPRANLPLAETAALLRPALTGAVRRRVGDDASPAAWSADVSGGLDSGTLGALAADKDHGTDVLGCVYHDAHTSVADLDGARGIADLFPRLDLRITVGDAGTAHYTGLDGSLPIPRTDRPASSISMRAMDRAYLAPAADAHRTDHLVGVGGDEVLDAPSAWWADYLRTHGSRSARQHIRARARLAKTAPGPIIAAVAELAATKRERGLLDAANDLERGIAGAAPAGLAWAWQTSAAPWLSPDGRAAVADLLRSEARVDEDGSPGAGAQDVVIRSGGRAVAALGDLHSEFGLRVHAPFLDNQVVTAALSAPGWVHRDPHVFKPVLGAAMRGLVPDLVLNRRSKGTFTPTMLLGIRRNLSTLRALLFDGALARSGLFDTRAVITALDSAGDGNARAPLAALNQAIAIEVWAAGLDTTASAWWAVPA
ncbi:asparagine synthase-related protein [Embleya sp. NPDC050493]|uniref:asparagine synthase-related protein n=1 Tax=Embleya sp. NPDC050493 TaxID=3363989 RepID=UPI0037A95C9D